MMTVRLLAAAALPLDEVRRMLAEALPGER